jgi:prepilin-type N-terminal cleavage/methylation domain-containing protein
MKRNGFTLIELLVVIAIIGIWRRFCSLCSPRRARKRDRRSA